MNTEQKKQFENYLDEVLAVFKQRCELVDLDREKETAREVILRCMQNIQEGKRIYQNFEEDKYSNFFDKFPDFHEKLTVFHSFQRAMPIANKSDFVAHAIQTLNQHRLFLSIEEDMAFVNIEDSLTEDQKILQAGPYPWLQMILTQMLSKSGSGTGQVTMSVCSTYGEQIQVTISGDLATQYSARQFLASFYADKTLAPVVTDVTADQQITYQLDRDMVYSARDEYQKLVLFKELMLQQDYEIEIPGKKNCQTELFVHAKAVENRNESQVIQQWGITLQVALALEENGVGDVVFPFAAHLKARDVAHREQFKQYFKEAGVCNFDKTQLKTFICDEFGRESLECNISLSNAEVLWTYFLRLDALANKLNSKANVIPSESEWVKAQAQIRQEQLLHLISLASASGETVPWECNEDTYAELFEKFVNKFFIRCPEAFRLMMRRPEKPSSLALVADNLGKTLNQGHSEAAFGDRYGKQSESYPSVSESYAYCNESERGRSFSYKLGEYLVAVGQMFSSQLTDGLSISSAKFESLRQNARLDLRDYLEVIEQCLSEHSAYFFVKTVAEKIDQLLNNPYATEEAIELILTEHGVKDIDQYKIHGMSVFNHYKIKFDILTIALNACLEKRVLLSFHQLKQQKSPWITNQNSSREISKIEDFTSMLEWNLNTAFPIGWVSGNRQTKTDAAKYTQTRTADQQQNSASTANYSGSSTSNVFSMFTPPEESNKKQKVANNKEPAKTYQGPS